MPCRIGFSGLRIALAAGAFGLAFCDAADIATAQYDNSRTLWNGSETLLKTSNVNSASFGKVFTKAVDGWIYAQPLYLENMAVPGRGTINIVYVATMHNTVYAFDADNPNAATVWSTNLGASDTSIPYLGPELGILSTPVIVRERQALYAVATNFESGHRVFRLHALDLLTGAEKFGGPVIIGGQVQGAAPDAVNGVVTFDPDRHRQRTSLAVANNSVYVATAGMDVRPFHGWIFGYDISTLQQTGVYCDTANGVVGGIWTSGRAPAVDANGALYVETGDGDFDGATDFGDAILKLTTSGSLQLADWFTPDNWSILDQNDWDLGSSAPTLIAGANRLVGGSKAGWLYVLDTTNLGHIASGNTQIVQSFLATPGCSSNKNDSCAEIHGQAFWNSNNPTLYIWAWRDVLKAYPFLAGQLDTGHVTSGILTGNYPGGLLAGSSNGSAAGSGIVWAITADLSNSDTLNASAGTLRAFDASDVTHELWNSGQNAMRDALGNFAKFVSPVVANGKVYVATFSNQLVVYGMLNVAPALTIGKSHIGNFAQGQQNATYAVVVANTAGAGSTNGMVTVTESLPSGLTLVSMSGTGWSCGSGTCTRSDSLAGGASYPTITVTVNVGGNASSPQVNQVMVSGGGSFSAGASDSTAISFGAPPTGSASFVKMDQGTQGNWRGVYGGDGYAVVGDTASNPAYVTPAPAGQNAYTWASSTGEVRALQKASNVSDRIAATWYAANSFTVDLTISDGSTHQVAVYLLDWDTTARREMVDILDANGNVLDSQSLTGSFSGGVYLVWNVSGHVKLRVTATGGANSVLSGLFFGAGGSGNLVTGSASFVKQDTATQGNWRGVYGGDGYNVIGDQSSNPAYVTPVPAGQNPYTWVSSTSDLRAPQKASNLSDRVAGTWYSSSSFTVDLPIADANTHQLALYCLDWDTAARRETVDILDANGNVLNSQSLTTSFNGGVYLVWNVSGHVKVRVTLTGGANAVLSGLFFATASSPPSSSAAFVKQDTTAQGNWHGLYGGDGYTLVGDAAANPGYVTPIQAGQNAYTWVSSTGDPRALQKGSNPSDRIAAVWYAANGFTVDLPITDTNTHQLAVYCLDWDTTARRETVDILDANGNVLNSQSLTGSFNGGVYLVWNVSGHVKVRVTLTGGPNAVISGLFFGGGGNASPGSASFVKQDATTQGNWHGVYGLDGYIVLSDQAMNPNYVTPSPAGQNAYTWVSSTGDARALQKPSNLQDRVAGVWYTNSSFTVDLPITDANTHQLALYCLDWDTTARRETVDILDANGNVLNSQSLTSSFNGGVYLVWNVSGHVKVRVTLTGGANAVISGLFFR